MEDSDIKLVISKDSNGYYLALQVIDHKVRVEKLEMTVNGEYQELKRETHNMFTYQPGNEIVTPFDIKITLIDGSTYVTTITEIKEGKLDVVKNKGDDDKEPEPEATEEQNESESENQNEIQLTKEDLESVYPLIVFGFMQVKEIFNMILGMLGTIKELLIVETLLNIVE